MRTHIIVQSGMVALALICFLSIISFNQYDSCFFYESSAPTAPRNLLGTLGAHIAAFLLYLGGSSLFWSIPAMLTRSRPRLISFLLLIPVTACISNHFFIEPFSGVYPGGILGIYALSILRKIFDDSQVTIFLFIALWSLLIILCYARCIRSIRTIRTYITRIPGSRQIAYLVDKSAATVCDSLNKLKRQKYGKRVTLADIQDDPFWHHYVLSKRNQNTE